MIPGAIITEWRAHSPWTSAAHVEQDLIIARALVELYSEPEFSAHLLFRGGTALHKLVLHPSARDLTRGSAYLGINTQREGQR
jgi:predicted nucleotidyltransferase component of viral defense system